jgi:FkbM family methyltransferase
MNYLKKFIIFSIVKLIGQERLKRLIPVFASFAGLDLLLIAYNNIGILKYQNAIVSGENFLITKILNNNLSTVSRPILFDVGANVGNYSLMLIEEFPQSKIYAFEPNINTFQQLVANIGNSVRCVNAGLGSEEKAEKIYTYSNNLASTHASIYKEVFSVFHGTNDIIESEFQMMALDDFCEKENIDTIDFLKIDTEGNELNVFKGGKSMISNGRVKIIQFEFGEGDVFSRVFLKDFYNILTDYNIYRIDSERLIPLFKYNVANEIFHYQNLIAVRKDLNFQSYC